MENLSSKNFVAYFDKLAWGAITAVCIFAATQLQKMSDSIIDLNKNLAVLISRMDYNEKQIKILFEEVSEHRKKLYEGKK
jgi:hypothetical protein